MTTPHKHRDILIAIADGKKIQYQYLSPEWKDCTPELALSQLAPDYHSKPSYTLRIAPETITVNGVVCPKDSANNVNSNFAIGIECRWNHTNLIDQLQEERCKLAAELAAARAQEPVSYRYKFTHPISGEPVWRDSSRTWNGQCVQEVQPLFAAPVPPVREPVAELPGHS